MEKIHKPATENVSSSEKFTDMMLKVIPQKKKGHCTVFLTFHHFSMPVSVLKNAKKKMKKKKDHRACLKDMMG